MKTDSDQIIVEKILQHTDLKHKKVLEVGCGAGRISSLIVDKVGTLVAIDPDAGSIGEACNSIPGVLFRVGSGENLDFLKSSFDMVIFTLSLHHQNSKQALKEAAKVLKDGGEIFVIEPTFEGEIQQILSIFHDENQAKQEAQDAIKESGLYFKQLEKFDARWVFEDKEDLYQSLFDYYDMPFNINTAQQISALVGEKQNSAPIILKDSMLLQALIIAA